jgi:glycosyltransferase involved in cell wall biosynthesis
MKPTLSIVIITMNRPVEIGHCLDHIARQSEKPLEVIVVDASKKDESQSVVESMKTRLAGSLNYVRSAPGMARQRRLGFEIATGQVILFLDDDVYIEQDFVRELLQVYELCDMSTIGGVTGHDPSSRRPPSWSLRALLLRAYFLPMFGSGRFRLSGMHTTANGLSGIRRVEFMGGGFTSYRRAVLIDIPPDGESFAGPFEDADLSYRVSRVYRNYYTAAARCVHKPSGVNRRPPAERSVEMLEAYKVFWRKNVPDTPLRRWAFRRACRGLAAGIYFMTPLDAWCFLIRNLLGARLYCLGQTCYRKMGLRR